MSHCNSRAISTTPALIRKTERRCRTGDGIDIRITVICVYGLWRGTALTHRIPIESPVLIPSHLDLSHEKRTDSYVVYRRLICFMKCLFFLTTHFEWTSGDSNHLEWDHCSGNLFYIVGERGNCSWFLKKQTGIRRCPGCILSWYTNHLGVIVVRIVMSCIQMATNTL